MRTRPTTPSLLPVSPSAIRPLAALAVSFPVLCAATAAFPQDVRLPDIVIPQSRPVPAATSPSGPSPSVPATGDGAVEPAASASVAGIAVYTPNRTANEAAAVGSSVEVLTTSDIEARPGATVKDYLATLPGVSFNQSGGLGTATGIFIRGAGTQYVKVLIDGIDISDPSGTQTSAALENVLIGDIARIEVLKGSQSTLYGGDAVGGVISIATRGATEPGAFAAGFAEYGAYQTWRGSGTVGYAGDRGDIALSVGGVRTDGFSAADERNGNTEDDGYENLTVSGRGEVVVSEAVKVFFAFRSVDADVDFDDFDFVFGAVDDTAGNRTVTEQRAGRIGTELTLFGGALVSTFAVQGLTNERENFGSFPNTFEGDRVKVEHANVVRFSERLSLLAGADFEQTGAESSDDPIRQEADLAGAFAQLMLEPVDGLVFTGGGRRDEHSTFGDFDTYRFTSAYLFAPTSTKVRASAGSGFRTPSLFELFSSDFGNRDLTPEESTSWDAGVDQWFVGGKARLSATYFELDTENLIDFDFTTFRYANVEGVTRREGVELAGAVEVMPGLVLSSSYTLVDANVEDGSRAFRVPRHSVVLAVDAEPIDKLAVHVQAKVVRDTLDISDVVLDDYVLVNAKVSYEFAPGLRGYVRGENLLGEEYQTVFGYGTSDLAVFGGIEMKWPD
ncbi:MAG: TonB-dependent receptor [Hyphomicrobiaceae bacterium]|nr:TonB-dependent receptor [Hyphomicrobiaceae bacterium]